MRNPLEERTPTPEIQAFLDEEVEALQKLLYPTLTDTQLKDGIPKVVYSKGFYPHKNPQHKILGEPFFTLLREDMRPATPLELANPNSHPLLALELPQHYFHEWVTFLPGGEYRSLWIGGMAAYSSSSRTFLVQDIREQKSDPQAVYCMATLLKMPFIFGKVVPGKLRDDVLQAFASFLNGVADGT